MTSTPRGNTPDSTNDEPSFEPASARVRALVEEILTSGRSPEDVCASEPELLDDVKSRLRRIERLVGELDRAFPSSTSEDPPKDGGRSTTAERLPRIPGYDVLSVLGRGGMGVVYRATHLTLRRTVALKMLRGGDAPAKELDKLLREARTLAGLGHPHVVEVFDAGVADGLPYFTMELVEGGSLADRLRGVPMAPREAAELVQSLATAIQAAHDRGVVHRDLKPGNVLVTTDGIAKVSDFGLARGADAPASTDAARFGTPSYMAPEQARGTPEAFHRSVDVYALGAILYETLTGRPPFRANSPVETQRQVLTEDPVAPSRINPSVPRDLETICLKCLHKQPAARYETASALHDDLRRYLDGEPIKAKKTGPFVRAAKWAKRHPTTTTVLGFVAVLTAAAIVALASRVATTAATHRVVESDLDEAERAQRASDRIRANAALDRATLRLGKDGPHELRSRIDAARRNDAIVSRLDAIRLDRALGTGSPAAFAASDAAYAQAYHDACGVGDATPPQEAARRIADSPIRAELTAAMYDWHLFAVEPRRKEWMLAVLRIVDPDDGGWRDRARDSAVPGDRAAVARLVEEFRADGQSPAFLLWFAMLVRNSGLDPTPILRAVQAAHPADFWSNFVLAFTLHQRGQTVEAMRFMQAAIAVRPDVGVAHGFLGNYLRMQDRLDESLERLTHAVALDPDAAILHGNLAHTLMALGRPTEALPHVEFCVASAPDSGPFRLHLGHVLVALGRDDAAIEQLEQASRLGAHAAATRENLLTGFVRAGRGREAVELIRASIPQDSADYAAWDGFLELCAFAGATEDYAKARATLLTTFGGSDDPAICEALYRATMLAPIDDEAGRVAQAAIERALAAERERPTGRLPSLGLAQAMVHLRCGRPDAALQAIDDEVRLVLEPIPQLVAALALCELGKTDEALAALAEGASLGDWRRAAASEPEGWICHALRREAEAKLLPRRDDFVAGQWWPTGADERIALIATSEDRDLPWSAARLFAEAFEADPQLAQRIKNQCRYRAAVAAAVTGCGGAADGKSLTADERRQWRQRALQWLRDEFAALPTGTMEEDRAALLAKWRTDPDLRVVRDPAALAELPDDEREAFTALWRDVDAARRALATGRVPDRR